LRITGSETGFINLDDSVPGEEIEFGEKASEDVLERE
jgi:hypothetical protein